MKSEDHFPHHGSHVRFQRSMTAIEDERKVARVILEAGPTELPATIARATLPGDNRRLRGIPVVARGVAGASPGTVPGARLW